MRRQGGKGGISAKQRCQVTAITYLLANRPVSLRFSCDARDSFSGFSGRLNHRLLPSDREETERGGGGGGGREGSGFIPESFFHLNESYRTSITRKLAAN